MRVIDLRSDTVTLPTPEMRKAMAEAEVGDDVWGDDPTVNRLEAMAAEMMGKEAAVFMASGTMSNLVSVLTHCQRGDEIIMGSEAHMFHHEVGGASALAGVQIRLVRNDHRGMMDPDEVRSAIRAPNIHNPRTALLCIENTHNRCSGGVLTPEDMKALADVAHENGLKVHLDGARIFNAAVYLGIPARELTKHVDDVCFCISKGLSCPVGSLLCGSKEFVARARKWRKMVGGGMRQVGILAAAGIVALESMIDRLAEDHQNAQVLARGLAQIPGIHLDPNNCPTNIVIFEIDGSVPQFIKALADRGLKVSSPGGQRIRMVTHYGITGEDIEEALSIVEAVARERMRVEAR